MPAPSWSITVPCACTTALAGHRATLQHVYVAFPCTVAAWRFSAHILSYV